MRRILIASMLSVGLAACGTVADPGADEDLSAPTTTSTIAEPTTSLDLAVEDTLADESDVIAAAIADLASRLQVDPTEIEVFEVREVQWSDGAIGCPKDGEFYTQAIVDGKQVLLDSNGAIYDYHADDSGRTFLCESDEEGGGYSFVPPPRYDE